MTSKWTEKALICRSLQAVEYSLRRLCGTRGFEAHMQIQKWTRKENTNLRFPSKRWKQRPNHSNDWQYEHSQMWGHQRMLICMSKSLEKNSNRQSWQCCNNFREQISIGRIPWRVRRGTNILSRVEASKSPLTVVALEPTAHLISTSAALSSKMTCLMDTIRLLIQQNVGFQRLLLPHQLDV